jgi:murein DD-endopeptidase MepM/ murein hydrolase activator NlpD
MLVKVSNYNNLQLESESLRTHYKTLESVVGQTNTKLESLQALAGEVALAYGFRQARRPRFPQAVLALATQNNSTLDSGYQTSVYAFNLMKNAALGRSRGAMKADLLPSLGLDSSTFPSIWPVRGQITGGFGERMDPFSGEDAFHAGLDISAPSGTKIAATADGIILHAGPEARYGNEILIDHGSGVNTRYGHLSRIYVVAGEMVKQGQMIGAVGMTGKATGPHLHYEVLVHEVPVNPGRYLLRGVSSNILLAKNNTH